MPSSTFAHEKILERADLQRLLRAHIEAIADDVLILAEEFGAFADARRRIDLLGIDREGQLVIFQTKRTPDGGHLELQALRYAAMISTMTFDDLVGHYETYLATVKPEAADEAQACLANWLDDGDGTVISRHVRIVLVSAGFDREITTTVLWLTSCYRTGHPLRPAHSLPGRRPASARRAAGDTPAPEASELTIQLQRKATQERAIRATDGRDWTQYVITGPEGESEPLRKRQPVLAMVTTLQARLPASHADRHGHPAVTVPLRKRHARRGGTEASIHAQLPEGRRRPLFHGGPRP